MKFLKVFLVFVFSVMVMGVVSVRAEMQGSGEITISMNPPSEYGITISQEAYDFGDVTLDSSYLSTDEVITVTNSGLLVADWKIRGDHSQSDWKLAGQMDPAVTPNVDEIHLMAVLSDTLTDGSAIDGYTWVENDSIIHDVASQMVRVGEDLSAGRHTYDGSATGDDVGSGESRRIWFKLRTPGDTTVHATAQEIGVTIEAWDAATFSDWE